MAILIKACPQAGEGVHPWLLSEANRCRWGGLSPTTTSGLLREATRDCGRAVPDREIDDAVQKAFESDGSSADATTPKRRRKRRLPPLPEPDAEKIREIVDTGYGLVDLWEASPIRFEDEESHTEEIIDALFPGDPLLCCAWSKYRFDTRLRSAWRDELSGLQFIVPSPMASVWGVTQEGKASKHSLAHTGPRRFLVCEFDSGDLDGQAARLLHLGGFAPLVLALHSGGKSLHGWFFVEGQSETRLRKFFRYAASLGADKALWTRSQFARIPDGQHKSGARQTVYFFSLQPLSRS